MSFKRRRLFAFVALFLSLSVSLCFTSCKKDEQKGAQTDANGGVIPGNTDAIDDPVNVIPSTSDAQINHPKELFTDRDQKTDYDKSEAVYITLADNNSSCYSPVVQISGNTVTVKAEGTYVVSGSLSNGSLKIDATAEEKIHLILNGVSICCEDSAALEIKQADKVFITLEEGSVNTLSNKNGFTEPTSEEESNVDAVIFSKDDLTLNGAGTLTIDSIGGHGIVSKDDLIITGGSYTINADNHALSGKDRVCIKNGKFNLNAEKDAIHAENNEDTALGYLYIESGEYIIVANGDAISASATLQIDGGTYNISSGGGSAASANSTSDNPFQGPWGSGSTNSVNDESYKGVKSADNMAINGGTFTLDCADDGFHSGGALTWISANATVLSGDDGLHADDALCISGGTIDITKSYEGLEGTTIEILAGNISIVASDDGLNAAGGNDQSGMGGAMMRPDAFGGTSSSDAWLKIAGGILNVNAGGDGLDSNGSFYITGGETYVAGPTSGGNGLLDFGGTASITGGILIAYGGADMLQNFGTGSTQGSILCTSLSGASGSEISIKDKDGKVLASVTAKKSYRAIIISCPELEKGNTYTLCAGATGTEITLSSLIYGSGSGMGGGGARPGGRW